MSRVVRPTLPFDTPRAIAQAILYLQDAVDQLQAENDALTAQIAAQPPILTLQQIRTGLSANGQAPLDLTGLTGMPVTS